MKSTRRLGLLAGWLGAGAVAAAAGAAGIGACGSSSGGASVSDGGTLDTTTVCQDCNNRCEDPPPPVPLGAPTTTGLKSHNYAIHDLFLGDTDRSGVASPDAWKTYGYNIDGLCTLASSRDVCTPAPGASRQVQVDGDQGIDNSFGANVMPLLTMFDSTLSQTINQSIQSGDFSVFMYVTGFDESAGNTTSATGLTGVLLAGDKYSTDGGVPSWDLTTSWPVRPDPGFISGCSPYPVGCPAGTDPVRNAVIKFVSAFQSKGTFFDGTPAPFFLPLGIGDRAFDLDLASSVISFDPKAPGAVTNGTVAGVIDTVALISVLRSVAGDLSTSLCTGSAFRSLVTGIEQSQDILINGTTVSNAAGSACNAISIGLGFDAVEIGAPTTIAPPTPPGAGTCDAGTDAPAGDAATGDGAADGTTDAGAE